MIVWLTVASVTGAANMANLTAARQAAGYIIRKRQRGRQFADALTVHTAGLVVVGANDFGGMLLSGAMFVQDANGNPWVALTSGTTGGGALTGNGTVNDGGVTWLQFGGRLNSAPPTPA
jgi:hypothetical protein